MKKILSLLLSASMLVSLAVGCSTPSAPAESEPNASASDKEASAEERELPNGKGPEDKLKLVDQKEILAKVPKTEPKGQIIVGDGSEPDDSMINGWTNNTPNHNAKVLMHLGYNTFELDRTNEPVANSVVLKNYTRTENADGSVTYEEEIYDNLKWSDGTPITAQDYIFSIMIGSSKAMGELGSDIDLGATYNGYDAFTQGDGNDVAFKGLRLLSNTKFSVTISKDELPNYYEIALGATVGPVPMKAYLPEHKLVDSEEGVKFDKPVTVADLEKTVMDPVNGYRFNPQPVAGPYLFKGFDKDNKAITLERNPEFLGTFDGWLPQIKTIIIKGISRATRFDELEKGTVDILSPVNGKDIDEGKAKVEASNDKLTYKTFDRNGFGYLTFHTDVGPTQFAEVRQAIAHSLDRDEFIRNFSGGYGFVVNGYYGAAQWEYKENKDEIDSKLNKYPFDLNKAKELLIAGGWTLNASGADFVEGTDEVRYKKLEDGNLMPLIIRWAKTENNPVSDLLTAALPENVAKIGMKIEDTAMTFPKLIENLYASPSDKTKRDAYHLYNLALGFADVNTYWRTFNPDPRFANNNPNQINDEKLYEIAESMKRTPSTDREEWSKKWFELQVRWNELLPMVPLYSDIYHLFYSSKIENYTGDAINDYGKALKYAVVNE